jgi:subtilase family serine protease
MMVVLASLAFAQESPAVGTIHTPLSTLGIPGLPRTPLYVFIPEGGAQPAIPLGETPASIACIYGVTTKTAGCPKSGTVLPTGGTKAIAVVEYGQYTNMTKDAQTFSSTFGLPAPNVTQVCAESSCPANNGTGWDLETALDVQWAHAMAPNAQIYVVSFATDPLSGGAEQKAAQLVAAAGGGEVSNSWGYNGGEFSTETQLDTYFVSSTDVFFASAGDSGAIPQYPSVSPNVVSAGGTTIVRDSSGNFKSEQCWSGSGGGPSTYEKIPPYQSVISTIVGTHRGTPDIAAVADPNSGVAVYSSSYCGGWCIVGGTSAAAPILAGITNTEGHFLPSTRNELSKVYREYGNPTQDKQFFRDETTGNNGFAAQTGWDYCTGVGSPRTPRGE